MIDEHYDRVNAEMRAGKDSIFEPCKIISYDTKTMTARVYFLRSSREKEDALVLFPSFSVGSALMMVPTPESTALAFWGPDRQVFVIPAQYALPNYELDEGVVRQNASLEQYDKDLSMDHLEPGEFLARTGGSHLYLTTAGDIEMMTRDLFGIRLESEGMLHATLSGYRIEGEAFAERSELHEIDGLLEQRKVERYGREKDGFEEEDPRAMTDAIMRFLAQTETPDALSAIPDLPTDDRIVIETGAVLDGSDAARLPDGERVVRRIRAGHGTIWIGETGTIRVVQPGLSIDVSDDVYATFGERTYPLSRLIERIERLSVLAGIEEVLHDEG